MEGPSLRALPLKILSPKRHGASYFEFEITDQRHYGVDDSRAVRRLSDIIESRIEVRDFSRRL